MQAHLSWWASTPSTAEMAAPLRVNFSGTLQNSFDENVQKKFKLCFWTWNVMIENSLEVELLSKDGLAALDGTLGDCLQIVQNISIEVIASNVEYLFFKHFTRFVCFLQRCLQNIFVKITSLLYPPSRPYTMGTLPSKRLRRAFNNYNSYNLMNTQ